MPIIDAHVHLYPSEANRDPAAWAAAQGEPHWAALSTRLRRNGTPVQAFPDLAGFLREMDSAGVERCVLLGWYWNRLENCAAQNRFYAACVRAHPDRLSAFATIQPRGGSEGTLAEMRRAREEGLLGLGELSPHAQGYGLDMPGFRDALLLAGEWSWPVNLHVTDPNSRDFPGRVQTPLEDFERLAREYPATTFILAHWGGLWPLRDPNALGLTNVCYDTAASPLLYDESVWERFLSVVPADRILFGSDFPLNLYPKKDPQPSMAGFLAEAQRAGVPGSVMHENARRLLRAAASRGADLSC